MSVGTAMMEPCCSARTASAIAFASSVFLTDAHLETDDENDRAQLLVLGRKGGGKPPIPPTSKKLQKTKKKKKKNVKDEQQDQQKRLGQSLAARMGFTATVVGSTISSVTERRRRAISTG